MEDLETRIRWLLPSSFWKFPIPGVFPSSVVIHISANTCSIWLQGGPSDGSFKTTLFAGALVVNSLSLWPGFRMSGLFWHGGRKSVLASGGLVASCPAPPNNNNRTWKNAGMPSITNHNSSILFSGNGDKSSQREGTRGGWGKEDNINTYCKNSEWSRCQVLGASSHV